MEKIDDHLEIVREIQIGSRIIKLYQKKRGSGKTGSVINTKSNAFSGGERDDLTDKKS